MSVTIRFACGHQYEVADTGGSSPVCPLCGETRVQHVTAPPPKFRGFCTGPRVESK